MGDLGWSAYISAAEASADAACVETAIKNGHTPERAEMCDDGDVGCPDCPFVRMAINAAGGARRQED